MIRISTDQGRAAAVALVEKMLNEPGSRTFIGGKDGKPIYITWEHLDIEVARQMGFDPDKFLNAGAKT